MKLAVLADPDFPQLERIPRDVEISDAAEAEAILLAPRFGSQLRDVLPRAKHVRWIHALAAGVETLPFDLLHDTAIVVTNSRGIYADALGEFAIAAMLWFAKDLRRLVENQRARRWEPLTVQRLEGKTAAIIGYGGIGKAIGRRAEAMGMKVTGVRRGDDIEPALASDFVVLATPLTPATRGMMNRNRIAAMTPETVLINVSRGAVVDEGALVEALRNHRIRGAALDVFEVEPLPDTSPLWSLDNVLLSPHSADHTTDAHERAMTFFLKNLARFRSAEPLENVVDKESGY
ncbi:MAG: D-2-hydroxyacid dehydrogenase [Thermoanaerobaculia bacterium]